MNDDVRFMNQDSHVEGERETEPRTGQTRGDYVEGERQTSHEQDRLEGERQTARGGGTTDEPKMEVHNSATYF
eukprot:3029032-Rhodomonas_salina.1